jgi:hypothetical protein
MYSKMEGRGLKKDTMKAKGSPCLDEPKNLFDHPMESPARAHANRELRGARASVTEITDV